MCTLNAPHQCAHSTTFTCRCQTPTHTPTHSYTRTRTHTHTHAHTLLHTHKHSGVDIAWRRGHSSDANRCVRSRVWAHWRVESSRHGFIIGVWGRVVMVLSLACRDESSWCYHWRVGSSRHGFILDNLTPVLPRQELGCRRGSRWQCAHWIGPLT